MAQSKRFLAASIFPAACLSMVGCATAPAPTPELAAAHALIAQAETGSAQQYASADLERARTEYQGAEKLQSGDPAKATRLAQQAGVDAKVAMANAQAEKARQALNEVKAGTRPCSRKPIEIPRDRQPSPRLHQLLRHRSIRPLLRLRASVAARAPPIQIAQGHLK